MRGLFKPNIEKMKRKKDTEGLIRALSNKDYGIKIKAVEALGKIEDKKAIDALVKFIGEIDSSEKGSLTLKQNLIFKLLLLASDARKGDLINYSKNKSREALINMGTEAIDYLIELYIKGYGDREVITKILLDTGKDQTGFLISSLRYKIATYSYNIDSYEKKNKLQKLEGLSNEIIVNIGRQTAKPLSRILKSENKQDRIWAAFMLGKIENEEVVKDLIIALNDSDKFVIKNSIRALSKVRSKEVAEALVNVFKTKEERDLKEEARIAIRNMGKYPVEALTRALKDKNEDVRIWAAWSLSEIEGKEEAITDLIAALSDINWEVRKFAVDALAEIKDKNVEQALIKALDDNDSRVRYRVVDALGKTRSNEVKAALVKSLEDDDMYIRYPAALILGKMGEPRAIDQILKCLFEIPRLPVSKELKDIKDTLCILIPESLLTHEIVDNAINASTYSDYLETGYLYEKSNSGIKYLCNLKSPITSNLLNLVVKKKDIEVTTAARCANEEDYTRKLSFQTQRDLALEELKRRENPPYDPGLYLKD